MTILVAEDETIQRQILSLILEMDGYTVLAASNGEEALQLSRRHSGDIALLITDIQMPGMTGIQLYREVIKDRPTIKVLLVSGVTSESVVDADLRSDFLRKPLLPGVLREKVSSITGGARQ